MGDYPTSDVSSTDAKGRTDLRLLELEQLFWVRFPVKVSNLRNCDCLLPQMAAGDPRVEQQGTLV